MRGIRMGCPSTVACRLGTGFVCYREEGRSPRHHYRRFSFQPSSSVAWPSLSTTGVHQSTSLLASDQEGFTSSHDLIEDNMWHRVELFQRLLDVSIAEENYLQAKQVHDQLSGLRAQLPESDQLLLDKIGSLAKGNIDDKLKVICELGEIGDDRVVPMLAGGLLDSSSLIASETEKAMWKIFMRSGSKDVDQHLQDGLALMLSNNLLKAKDVFAKVIEMAPSFAEGWNKRATVNYLLQDYQASIMDCKQTLELNPYHFGALSGMGLCYAALDDSKSALFWFEKAYCLHPGLGQINKFIKMLKRKLSELNNNEGKEANKENPWLDT